MRTLAEPHFKDLWQGILKRNLGGKYLEFSPLHSQVSRLSPRFRDLETLPHTVKHIVSTNVIIVVLWNIDIKMQIFQHGGKVGPN